MLYRKIRQTIEDYLKNESNKILIVEGARQIGKSYIIRDVGSKLFENYIELNFLKDKIGDKLFLNVHTTADFYFVLSMIYGNKMDKKENTIVFLDEIQEYPQFLTMLKFLKEEDKFTFIASGSELDITLKKTPSIPIGSIEILKMYQLDFEEFLIANGFNQYALSFLETKFLKGESLDESTHLKMLDLFKKYLIIGGLPDAINQYLATNNMMKIRKIQTDIHEFYGDDASKYDSEHKLKIKRIYDLIPSQLANKKKRMVIQNIENIRGKTFNNYLDEFDYLTSSGITLEVKAVSTPVYPLAQSIDKNLVKLYMNDVGLLTNIYYGTNASAILENKNSINLGTVYENVVASELKAHGFDLYYYDNNKKGEVDFLINDNENLTTLPLEIKSGKDYTIHSALNHFLDNEDYHVKKAYVLSNERQIKIVGKITYIPIYDIMFFVKK